MNNMHISWLNSLFVRLIAAIIVFVMLPVYMIGIGIYSRSINAISDEISKSEIAQTTYFLKDLENEIDRIRIQQYDCMLDEHLNKLSVTWDVLGLYERSSSSLQLQHRLFSIKNSSKYIKSVTAYILPINRMISDSNINRDADMEKYNNIRVPVNRGSSQLVYWMDKIYMTTTKSKVNAKEDPPTAIEIELNTSILKSALSTLNTYENSGAFLIDSSKNTVIASSTKALNDKLVTGFVNRDIKNKKGSTRIEELENERYFVATAYSEYLDLTLYKLLPVNQFLQHFNDFYFWAWIYTIIISIAIGIYSFSTYRMVHKPLKRLVNAFNNIEKGDFSIAIKRPKNDEFGYLYTSFNIMVKKLNTLIDQVYKQKILAQRAELKQLQSQINPHFLYNSFFVISTMARIGDNDGLEVFSNHLGEYFKYITRSGVEEVPLYKEIEHARIYTEIQAARFSNRIQISFGALPDQYSDLLVPRLIIQPVIENAFEHGLEKMLDQGLVRIDFEELDTGIIINIDDNGEGMSKKDIDRLADTFSNSRENMEVTGITNIHRRLQLKFGNNSGLIVSKSELGGVRVSIKIVQEENTCIDY